ARHVEEVGPTIGSVIERAKIGAIGGTDAVDHAGLEIRDEELIVVRIEGYVAERGAGIGAPFVPYLGERMRPVSVARIEPVDGAGAAAFAPHAVHPVAAGCQVQSECGGRRDVDVGRARVVDSDAEDLSDLTGPNLRALRLVDPVLALGRLLRRPEVDDAADNAIRVDPRRALVLIEGAGEARHERLARLQRLRGVSRLA